MTIAPHAPVTVCSSNQYTMNILAFSGLRRYGARNTGFIPGEKEAAFFSAAQQHPLSCVDGKLKLPLTFPQEDCYLCELFVNGESAEKFEIYALESDLFCLQPYQNPSDHYGPRGY